MSKTKIQVAHSPDSDDAFMFYALAMNRIDTGELEFSHILSDIETLNQKAKTGTYDVTAISVHAYAYLHERYDILMHGASIGDRYGPILIAKPGITLDRLSHLTVAVPGIMTSAYLAFRLLNRISKSIIVPFDQIISAVQTGRADAGLLIHEGQLTFSDDNLTKLLDLGEWWYQKTKLPLPLGVNGIKKDLDPELRKNIAHYLKQSISYALENRQDALNYALSFARGMNPQLADRFVGMYVNQNTLELDQRCQDTIQFFLDEAHRAELIPHRVIPRYVGAS